MFPEKSVNVERTLELKLSQNSRQDAEPFPAKRLSLRKDFPSCQYLNARETCSMQCYL